MKKSNSIILIICLFSFLDAQSLGTGSAAFLNKGMSARAIGMGSAYTAIVDDPTAVYWNPAGLLNEKIFQIQVKVSDIQDLNSTSFGDVNSPQLAFSYNPRKPFFFTKTMLWAFGAGVNSFIVQDIDQYDFESNYIDSFNYHENVFLFSAAFRVRFLKVGMTWKYIDQNFSLNEQFRQNNGSFFNVKPNDLGVMFHPAKYISVGLIMRDSTRVGLYDMYPKNTQMGIKFDFKRFKSTLPHFILAADFIVIQNALNKMNAGLEYNRQINNNLSIALRLGLSNYIVGMKGKFDDLEEISKYNKKGAMGLGMSWKNFDFDVAWVQEMETNPYSRNFVLTIGWNR